MKVSPSDSTPSARLQPARREVLTQFALHQPHDLVRAARSSVHDHFNESRGRHFDLFEEVRVASPWPSIVDLFLLCRIVLVNLREAGSITTLGKGNYGPDANLVWIHDFNLVGQLKRLLSIARRSSGRCHLDAEMDGRKQHFISQSHAR
jgi:hypothetical protein